MSKNSSDINADGWKFPSIDVRATGLEGIHQGRTYTYFLFVGLRFGDDFRPFYSHFSIPFSPRRYFARLDPARGIRIVR